MMKVPVVLVLSVVASVAAFAAEEKPEVSDSRLNIAGIFNSPLPVTAKKSSLRFTIYPHAGDLLNRDYLRTTVGIRYGLGKDLELSAETDAYFAHGLGDVKFFDSAGFGNVRLGTKYHVGEKFWPGWDTGVGARFGRPVGNPPAEMTDGLQHVAPYFTFARPIASHPGLRFFWGVGVDLVTPTTVTGTHEKNDLRDDFATFTTGIVWDRGAIHYTFETALETTRGIGRTSEDVIVIRPGVVWEVPRKYTFNSRSQWVMGLGCHLSEGPDGLGFGASGKLRVSFDFKRWWKGIRNRSTD